MRGSFFKTQSFPELVFLFNGKSQIDILEQSDYIKNFWSINILN